MELTHEKIIEGLKQVVDPELSLDIYTLGLVYNISITDDKLTIQMTLTSPMCPYGPQILAEVTDQMKNLGAEKPEIDLVFEPPWEPNDEVKELLGIA
jgi:metal-sulfur cluster biosynthetic enzyme